MGRPKGSKNKDAGVELSVVAPIIRVEGEPHPLEQMEGTDEMPILKSVGYAKVSPKSREWLSYVITSQGDKVLKIEVSEPNLRAIAMDEAKTSFVSNFMNDE